MEAAFQIRATFHHYDYYDDHNNYGNDDYGNDSNTIDDDNDDVGIN